MFRTTLVVLSLVLAFALGFAVSLVAGAPAQAAAAAEDAGRLDPTLADLAARAAGTEEVRLSLAEGGAVAGLAVFHSDAERTPEPVRALAVEEFPGATVLRYRAELLADIGRGFEVELLTVEGAEVAVAARSDGTLVFRRTAVAFADAPEPVRKAVEAALPGGKVVDTAREQGPEIDRFLVDVRAGGRPHLLRLDPAGKVLDHVLRVPGLVDLPLLAAP